MLGYFQGSRFFSRPLNSLCVLLAALALALFPTHAEEPAPPATDSVVVDAPTEAVLNGALRYLANSDIAILRHFIASMMAG